MLLTVKLRSPSRVALGGAPLAQFSSLNSCRELTLSVRVSPPARQPACLLPSAFCSSRGGSSSLPDCCRRGSSSRGDAELRRVYASQFHPNLGFSCCCTHWTKVVAGIPQVAAAAEFGRKLLQVLSALPCGSCIWCQYSPPPRLSTSKSPPSAVSPQCSWPTTAPRMLIGLGQGGGEVGVAGCAGCLPANGMPAGHVSIDGA